ncbi:unnamed protein product [Parnassius apollo]|uniref:(apollo) hypothetical protein n=1 Tax=Parnassius apollo TaxID=110799 RepID=A0A8S3XQR1_PARAO|nr:unnamed protein product [Parnassius apollo]
MSKLTCDEEREIALLLGRLIERKKTYKVLAPNWEIHSSYPLRENIWEYLHDDKEFRDFACTKGKSVQKYNKQLQHKHKRRGKNFLKSLIFFLLALGVTMSLWKYNSISTMELIAKVIPKTDLISILSMDYSTSVDAECCHRMRHLATELSRAQQALRSALRLRRNLMQTTQMSIPEYTDDKSVLQRGYVEGSKASKGSDTTEWGWRVSLWGVVPLWRASPPPDTILALRTPTPSDCWPFSGSYGEVIIELAHKAKLNYISIEHVRPDTARSAPKNFVVYGTFENNTRLEIARGIYTYNKPAKQYFALSGRNEPVTSVAFKVLSNQGNTKYTCVYRVHLYGSDVNKQKITL